MGAEFVPIKAKDAGGPSKDDNAGKIMPQAKFHFRYLEGCHGKVTRHELGEILH